MRTIALATFLIALCSTPAFAVIGEPGPSKGPKTKSGVVRAVNASELAIEVSINGSAFVALEPGDYTEQGIILSGSKGEAFVTARLLGSPEISGSGAGAVQAGKTTIANVTATASGVAVSFLKPGQVARLNAREAGIAVASTGGLLPLLALGVLLGRRPQRRPEGSVKPAA